MNRHERTFVILKPDSLQRSLVGEIIGRLERTGLKLVAIKMVRATEKQLVEHYGKDETWYLEKGAKRKVLLAAAGKPVDEGRTAIEYGKDIIRGIVDFMTVSPLVAMVWEGNHAVGIAKKLVGGTEPLTSGEGTIRGDLQVDSYSLSDADERGLRNLVHCSDKVEEAEREMKVWFTSAELHDYKHIQERILYDVDLNSLRE